MYPSNFTDVRFWTEIEFSDIVKCRWGSQSAVSSATGSQWSPGRGSVGKAHESFDVFTSGGQKNNLK